MIKKTIVTHGGGYHADDVFGCAVLAIFLEKENISYKIIRSRNEEDIKSADYVLDVGQTYTPERNRFDHHQAGGAGERENGIPYASFGLVWKQFGNLITNNPEIVEKIDQKLIQPVDAVDNGIDIASNIHKDLFPYSINSVLGVFAPNWEEDFSVDEAFLQALTLAKKILKREIKIVEANIKADQIIQDYYNKAEDKRVIVIDGHTFERGLLTGNMTRHPEPLIVIYKHRSGNWHIATCRDEMDSFESRIKFPAEWGGLQGKDLQDISGVPSADFCHPKLFLCGASSKEGALMLAEKIL